MFVDLSRNDIVSSSIDYYEPPNFDDLSSDTLELCQDFETLRHMAMVMLVSCILDGCSKNHQIGIISRENPHEGITNFENGPFFQA